MKLINIKIYCSCTSIYNIFKQTSLINLKSIYQNKSHIYLNNIYRTEIETLNSCKNII